MQWFGKSAALGTNCLPKEQPKIEMGQGRKEGWTDCASGLVRFFGDRGIHSGRVDAHKPWVGSHLSFFFTIYVH
jgi:hypothetical protein